MTVPSSFWPSSTVPIVLLPGGDQGQRVLALARNWVQLGLLGPALWVAPEDVTLEPGAPPVIVAQVMRLGPNRELLDLRRDLFEVLARDELRQVRVLKVRSATPRRELDGAQDAIAETLNRYVKHSVPSADPNQNISDQQLLLSEATLICAPTEFQVSQRVGWATDDPGLIVVASPEDRSSPWSGDAFVRDNDRFVGFCLMHIATVGGLWNAAPVGTFDLFRQEASTHHSIWVSRVFVNAVLMDGFADRVAAGVLADAGDGNSDIVDALTSVPPLGTTFIADERRSHYVDRVVEGIFQIDKGRLDYSPVAAYETRARDRMTFRGQAVSFASFSLDKAVAIPKWAIRAIVGRISRSATETFHSSEGLAVVGSEVEQYDIRDRNLVAHRDRVAAEVTVARSSVAAFDETAAIRSTPSLWARLREMMFGVLDGSADLTEIGFTPIEDKTPIFARVSDLVQPTHDRWQFPSDDRPDDIPASVGLEDLESLGAVRHAVTRWAQSAESLIAAREAERHEAIADRDALQLRSEELASVLFEHELVEFDERGVAVVIKGKRAPSPKKVDGEVEEGALDLVALKREFIELPARLAASERRMTAADVVVASAHDERQARHAVLASFEQWIAGHETSIYGRIVAGMTARRERAAQDLASAEEALQSVELPESGRLIALRKAFHRRFGIGSLITAGFMLLYFAVDAFVPSLRRLTWWPEAWQVIALGAAAIVILLIALLLQYYRQWSRVERLIVEVGDRLEWAANASRHARRELRRLEVLHRQAQEWLQLLADALHHPWAVRESWLAADAPSIDRSQLPYAMRLAIARDDDPVTLGRMKREASRALMVKGWRARAFSRLLEELRARLGYDAATLGIDSLDADLPHASNHSRRILMEHANDPELLQSLAQVYLREIVAEVQGVSLSHSNPRVSPVVADPLEGDESDAARDSLRREVPVEWDSFLLDSVVGRSNPVTPIGSLGIAEMALADAHHENVRSYLLVPDRLNGDARAAGSRSPLDVTAYTDSDVRALDLVLRVDVAGPIPVTAARLWENANSRPRTVRSARVTSAREGL